MAEDYKPDQTRDHAFDGIEEYDNDLPLWWQALFYISILVAILYVGYWHFGPGKLGAEAHDAELAAIEADRQAALLARGTLTEDDLRSMIADSARISRGEELYMRQNCQQCHQANGLGNIGPNLRDDYWKWGSDVTDIVETLQKGRNNNTMPAQNISPDKIYDFTAYLIHWNKTEKANGQGKRIEGEVEAPIDY